MLRVERIHVLLAALLLIGLLALAGCTAVPAAPPAAAPASGGESAAGGAASTELNLLCTPQVQWCEGMKAEFEKVNPDVTVNFVRMSSGEALARMRRTLEMTVVEGIKTSIPLHQAIIRDPDFESGDYSIKWLEQWLEEKVGLAAAEHAGDSGQ